MALLLALAAFSASPEEELFEAGVDYLSKGFFARARAAFAECLLAAPGEAVPTIFLGVSAAAEGRPARDVARILSLGVARMPEGKSLALDLRRRLPGAVALEAIRRRYASASGGEPVVAFLELFDGDPATAPALDRLLAGSPGDAYARGLAAMREAAIRAGRSSGSSPTTPPTASGSPSASSAASSDRSRTTAPRPSRRA